MSNSELIMVHAIMAFSSILIGTLGKLVRPEKPNSMVGYRTKASMRSQATWGFANEFGGNLMMWSSIATITLQIFAYFTMDALTSIYVTVGAMTIGLFAVIGITEYELRARFDNEGNPKSKSQVEDRF